MRIYIKSRVHEQIDEFYDYALHKHITLSERIVDAKKKRLYAALGSLSDFPSLYPLARLKQSWRKKGYRECIFEDFHFAYEIVEVDDEQIIAVSDATHSFLYK
jgi:hypothetical protein